MYTGPIHYSCLANNSTIRDAETTPKPPPADRTPPRGTLDDLPEEAVAHAADPGRQLNQYVLVRQIGRGGMGAVWKAWDRKLTRWIAVKFLLVEDDEAVDRFQREAKLAARLRHPNIAAIYEVGEAPSREAAQGTRHYLAMEYIDGHTLAEAKLTRPQLLDVFVKVARAIDSAHRGGVVHRDLKPPNIMVTSEQWPYVMDFGVAKALSLDSTLSVSGMVVGTPAYMPPEQAEGRVSAIDGRSDVYSLGATMYSVFLGRPPFEGESVMDVIRKVSSQPLVPPRQIDPSFPPDLEAVLLKAMAKDSKDRYPSAAALAADIARHLEGRRPEAPPAPAPVAPPRKGNGKAVLGIAAAALVLIGAAVGYLNPHWFAPKVAPSVAIAKPPEAPKAPPAQPPEPPVSPPVANPAPAETGSFTIKVAVHPFARIVSISRDGETVPLNQAETPAVLPDLRLGSYQLVLRHPQFGDRTVTLPRAQLKAGKTYVVWGQMGSAALDVKELP
jgi:predicted Ser/Thr protein kinase